MDKQKLQEQVDIVEERILRVGAYITLLTLIGGTGRPDSAQELRKQADDLGEALNALLELKQELELTSNLTMVE